MHLISTIGMKTFYLLHHADSLRSLRRFFFSINQPEIDTNSIRYITIINRFFFDTPHVDYEHFVTSFKSYMATLTCAVCVGSEYRAKQVIKLL